MFCHLGWRQIINILDLVSIEIAEIAFYSTPCLLSEIAITPPPASTVLWKSLNLARLLPAFIRQDCTNPRFICHIIEYFQGRPRCALTEAAVRNYFLELDAGNDFAIHLCTLTFELFDLQSTLRVCSNKCYWRVCAWIYTNLSLYEESIELALILDVSLAKSYANSPGIDPATRKRITPFRILNKSYI